MRYLLVSFFCLFILFGCDGGSSSSDTLPGSDTQEIVDDITSEETATDEDVTTEETDANQDSNSTIDYSLISCDDELSQVITLINEYRGQVQACGDTSYQPVSELTWNSLLALAAEEHSNNMSNYNFFSHTGIDESTVATRVTAQGYSWSYVAENLAAGYFSAQAAVDGLMTSEGHCKNIMSENVTEIGLACTRNNDAEYSTYWTQVFAKPLNE